MSNCDSVHQIERPTFAFSMQGQMAQAALAWTCWFWFLSKDQRRRTPSSLSMILWGEWQVQSVMQGSSCLGAPEYTRSHTSHFYFNFGLVFIRWTKLSSWFWCKLFDILIKTNSMWMRYVEKSHRFLKTIFFSLKDSQKRQLATRRKSIYQNQRLASALQLKYDI